MPGLRPCSRRTDRAAWRLATLVLLAAATGCAIPAEPERHGDGWEFGVSTLYWAVGIEGDVSASDGGGSTDASLADPLAFQTGAILEAEVERGPWSGRFEGLYVEYEGGTDELGPLTTRVGIDAGLAKLTLARRVDTGQPAVDLRVYAGARYAHLDTGLDVRAGVDRGVDKDWVDPLLGLRARAAVHPAIDIELACDIGGFGVASDLVWNLQARVDWKPYPAFHVFAGYNILDYDFDESPGSATIRYDLRLTGPILGVTVRF